MLAWRSLEGATFDWVAVKELEASYYNMEPLFSTICPYSVFAFKFLNCNPSEG